MRVRKSSIVFLCCLSLLVYTCLLQPDNLRIRKQLIPLLPDTSFVKMSALHLSKLFAMVCVILFCEGVVGDAQMQKTLSLPVNVGESEVIRCYMTSKPGRSCAVGDMKRAGARCGCTTGRCSIRCNDLIGCILNCRGIAA